MCRRYVVDDSFKIPWIYTKMTDKQLDLLCKIQAALPRRKRNKKAFDKTHIGNTRFYI